MKRKIEIQHEFTGIKSWKFFDPFYFFPTLMTYSLNTHNRWSESKFLYTRYVEIWFLWFMIGISWEYGKEPEEHNNTETNPQPIKNADDKEQQ